MRRRRRWVLHRALTLPEVALQYAYFTIVGLPWAASAPGTFSSWIPFLSNINSSVMVVYGVISGILSYIDFNRRAYI